MVRPPPWPEAGLEHLNACPVCSETARALLFDGLADGLFGAPGLWQIWTCHGCRAAYLDPRPTVSTISLAYQAYYTHAPLHPKRLPTARRGFKALVANGYLNDEFGHDLSYALPKPLAKALCDPGLALKEAYRIRHLPPPRPGARLLDLGCGNGNFLSVARDLGYQVTGLEPDPKAVEIGRAAGLEIFEGALPSPFLSIASFDQVTASHVIEHLHDPKAALRAIFDLLKPGGRVWISQPNLAALGLARFGKFWRGLEPPRHLTLFDRPGLTRLLEAVGFHQVRLLPADRAAGFYFRQSAALAAGQDPNGGQNTPSPRVDREARIADRKAHRAPELCESLTLLAFRPLADHSQGSGVQR